MKTNHFCFLLTLVIGVFGAVDSIQAQLTAEATASAKAAARANRRADVHQDTSELVVQFSDANVDTEAFAIEHGITLIEASGAGRNQYVFAASSPSEANQVVSRLENSSNISLVLNNQRLFNVPYFAPNDPYFGVNDLGGQWHLENNIPGSLGGANLPGTDARLTGAWNQNFTGSGVVIGIVDDSLQASHPDLAPNYNAALSYDFGQDDNDPSPVTVEDNHGTSVAGVAAARGGNGIGGTGAAPEAQLAGLRIDFDNQTAVMFQQATLHRSADIPIKNHSYGSLIPYVSSSGTALQADAITSTPETIHVFAAGNDRGGESDDTSKSVNLNLPNTIVVGATSSRGEFAFYSNFGASMIVSAPSDGELGITTTDRTGSVGYNRGAGSDYVTDDGLPDPADYTASFGGTSSATPLVAGVLALAKQANSALDTRMAKHLLVETSRIIDPDDATDTSDGGWRTNGGGNTFNQNYGFGLIDAEALVTAAQRYEGVTSLVTESTGTIDVDEVLFDQGRLTSEFSLETDLPLEDVLVTMDLTHTYSGDLTAFLISPSGFRSRLFNESFNDGGAFVEGRPWTFRSVAFWGESGAGDWEIELSDIFAIDSGVWHSFSVDAQFGSLVAAIPEPGSATVLGLMFLGFSATCRRRVFVAGA